MNPHSYGRSLNRLFEFILINKYSYPELFYINDFAQKFKSIKHKITILTGIPNYPGGNYYEGYGVFNKNREIYEGIEIFRSPLIPRGSGSSIRLALNYFSFIIGSIFTSFFLLNKQ